MPARTEVLVIGAGQVGLAVSWHLSRRGVEHLLLERGRAGEAWRSRRWDSFRLVTPNWFMRLPGQPDGLTPGLPDAFMSGLEMADALQRYAAAIEAPVRSGVRVVSLRYADPGYAARRESEGKSRQEASDAHARELHNCCGEDWETHLRGSAGMRSRRAPSGVS